MQAKRTKKPQTKPETCQDVAKEDAGIGGDGGRSRYLGDHLQDLVLAVWWFQGAESLQTTKTPQDLPLLLLQAQVAIGDQRLVPLHLLRSPSILLGAALHQPIVTHFLFEEIR